MSYFSQFKHLSALKFDQGRIEILRTYSQPKWAWANLIFSCLLMSLPLMPDEIATTPITWATMTVVFFSVVAVTFLFSRSLGSKIRFTNFLYATSTVNLFAAGLTSILAYVSLFVFEWGFDNSTIPNLIASILPFYIFIMYGFSADGASGLPEKKGWVVGVFGIIALYLMYYFFA